MKLYVIRRDCPGGPDWLSGWDRDHVASFQSRPCAARFEFPRAALVKLREKIADYNERGAGHRLQGGRAFAGQTFTIEEA